MTTPGYPRTFGSYVLLDRLGEGGMSEVDLARRAVDDANFVRFVVIKRIHAQHQDDDGFVRMFQDEARINAELQHENIASVYDFGQEGNEFFLAMEYVPGCDLRRVQRRLAKARRPFPLPIVLRICCDVLAALDYAHHRVDTYGRSMNIVHRDVNPRNIMLSVRGEVKLIDFGVAKADNRAEHTVGHSLKGKFAYMAPEQIEGGRDIDGRADIFALGIVLYELLMGCSPVAGLNEVQTMHRILSGQLPPVRSTPERPIPDALIAVHARACATRPDDRFATAGEMRQALLDLAPQCGGVASNQELSDFLSEIDPDFGQVSSRLRVLRDESTEELSRSRGSPSPRSEPVSSPGTLASGSHAPPRTRTRTVDAPTVAAAAGAGALVGVVVLSVAAFAVAWWLGHRTPEVGSGPDAPSPAATTTRPTPDAAPPGTGSPDRRAPPDSPPATPATAVSRPSGASSPPAAGTGAGDEAAAAGSAAADRAAPRPALDGAPHDAGAAADRPDTTLVRASPVEPGDEATPSSDEATPSGGAVAAAGATGDAATGTAAEQAATPSAGSAGGVEPSTPAPAAATTSASGGSSGDASGAPGPTGADAPEPSGSTAPDDAAETAPASTATDAASTAPVAGATGFVNISSRPTGLTVLIDGRPAGTSPLRAVELPTGRHLVSVTDPATGQTWQQEVEIVQGRTRLVLLGASP